MQSLRRNPDRRQVCSAWHHAIQIHPLLSTWLQALQIYISHDCTMIAIAPRWPAGCPGCFIPDKFSFPLLCIQLHQVSVPKKFFIAIASCHHYATLPRALEFAFIIHLEYVPMVRAYRALMRPRPYVCHRRALPACLGVANIEPMFAKTSSDHCQRLKVLPMRQGI